MANTTASEQLWANNSLVFQSQPLQFANTTSGYVPLALDYYESFVTGSNIGTNFSAGGWTSSFSLIRLGKIVILTINSATSGGTQVNNAKPAFPAGSIPARFAPSVARTLKLPAKPATSYVNFVINTDGSVTMQSTGGGNVNQGGANPFTVDAAVTLIYQL